MATAELVEDAVENTTESTGNSGSQDFFSSLQAFSASEWDRDLMLYLYRLEPRRPGTTKNPNIRKYTTPVEVDEIKSKYGSGKYQFILNRRDPKSKKGTKTLDTYVFEIEDPDFPPVVPGLDGWEKDPENARWAGWTKTTEGLKGSANGATTAEGTLIQMLREELARARASQPKDSIEAVAISKAMDVLTTAYKTGIENTSKGGSNGDGLAIVKEVLAVLGTNKEKKESLDPIITLLMTQQEKQINLMMKQQEQQAKELAAARERSDMLMLKLLEKKEEKSDVFGSFKGVVSAFKELQDLTGIGGTGEGAAPAVRGWPGIVLSALNNPQVGSLITGLGQAIPFWAARSAGARPVGGQPPPSGTRPIDTSVPPVPGAVGPDGPMTLQQPNPPNPPDDPNPNQIMYEIAGRAADAFTRRVRGGDFAQSIKDVYGLGVFEQIQRVGTAQILMLLKSAPFWPQLAPHEAEFVTFVQEFIDDVEYEDVPDVPEVSEPIETKRARKGAKA